ncbi:MAG: InlB B-repeat-containing protein, partial [bacterium]
MGNLIPGLTVAKFWLFIFALFGTGRLVWAQGQTITFSVTGDVPYGTSEVTVFEQQITNHNKYSPSAFLVHVGDILKGGAACNESVYSQVSGNMKGLAVPTYITPGDNETVDCSSPSQGFNFFLEYFQNFEQNFCGVPYTEHQSTHPENWAFIMDDVLFIGLNLVYGGSSANQQAADWVAQQLEANGAEVRAAVAFAHYAPNKSSSFSTPFRSAAAAFGKPILFMHGHGHSWTMSYPFPEQNILGVQVNNGGAEDPVEVTVTMNTSSPATAFTFKQNPWNGVQPYNMPPCVDAGSDQTITSLAASLQGQATDDGDPNGSLTTTWSLVSGPGTVTFGNANAFTTTASFSAGGTYFLRLMADDGQLQKSDEVTVVVQSAEPITPPTISSFDPTNGPAGTQVTIVGSQFTYVTNVAFNGTNTTSFTINSDTQILAMVPNGAMTGKISVTNSGGTGVSVDDFTVTAPPQYTLTVNTTGSGSVTLNPPGGTYEVGTAVELTATPDAGFQFSGWSGDLTGSTNPATLTMNANKNVTATFTAIPPAQHTL